MPLTLLVDCVVQNKILILKQQEREAFKLRFPALFLCLNDYFTAKKQSFKPSS